MTITSKVNKNNSVWSSLRTSIPKTIKETMGIEDKDTLDWEITMINGEWVAIVKLKTS